MADSTLPNLVEVLDITIRSGLGNDLNVTDTLIQVTLFDKFFSTGTSGNITLKDSSAIQEFAMLIGNELLTITYKDIANDTTYRRQFLLYGGVERKPTKNQKGSVITIPFVSFEIYENNNVRLRKTYRGSAFQIIGEIWDDSGFSQTSNKALDIKRDELPDRELVFCANKWSPFYAINWVLSRLSEDGQCDWVFYETPPSKSRPTEGVFRVKQISNLITQSPIFAYTVGNPKLVKDKTAQYLTAIDYNTLGMNSIDATLDGVWGSTTLTHNIIQKKWERRNYSYSEEYRNVEHTEQNPLLNAPAGYAYSTKWDVSEKVVADARNMFTILEDDEPENPQEDELSKADYIMQRASQTGQIMHGPILNMTVHGNSLIRAGNTLSFSTPISGHQSPEREEDRLISQTYFVTNVSHVISLVSFRTNISMVKTSYAISLPGGEPVITANAEGPYAGPPTYGQQQGAPVSATAFNTGTGSAGAGLGIPQIDGQAGLGNFGIG
jgi:hypothetical protein